MLRCGGGGWIRTIEGKASRFTVCPLWPLGYSSVFSWAKEGGAGGRIRTPDLLITNQLLYRLSYTSAEVFRIHSGAYYNSSRRACQPFFQKNSKIQKGEEMAAHGILEPSTPGGAAVLPVRGGALPRRPLFRAGRPGGMRGLPGAVCPAVFRRAAAPGGPGAAAAAATLFLRQRSTRENL